MKDKSKAEFKNTASDNNGGVQVNIPPEIARHNDIEHGDTIKFQTEWSDKHDKPYAALWNGTKHDADEGDDQ